MAETQQSCTTLMAVTPDRTLLVQPWLKHNNHVPLSWLSHLTKHSVCPAMAETYRIITTLMAVMGMGGGGGGEDEHKPCPTFRGENRQRGVALSQPPQASNKMDFINTETPPFWCSVIYTPIFHCLIQTLT